MVGTCRSGTVPLHLNSAIGSFHWTFMCYFPQLQPFSPHHLLLAGGSRVMLLELGLSGEVKDAVDLVPLFLQLVDYFVLGFGDFFAERVHGLVF